MTSVRELLEKACRHGQQVSVIAVGAKSFNRAKLTEIFEDFLSLEMLQPFAEDHFSALAECLILFHSENRAHVFLTSVRYFRQDQSSENPLLVVKFPTEVATESRTVFRVPVYSDTGLELIVQTKDGSSQEAQGIDLSLAGILVEFGQPAPPALSVGDSIELTLRIEELETTLHGTIRSQFGHRFGIYFPDTVNARGTIDAPATLRLIVNRLEREWLRRRVS